MLCFQASSLQSAAKIKATRQGGHPGRLSQSPFPPRKDAHTRDSSSPLLWGPPWLAQPRHRLQDPLCVCGVCWQAATALPAQPGLMSWCIYWRPQQSLPGPKVPAGAERRGSSAALIYTEHLLQGEGRNTLKPRKSRWWSSPGSPPPQQPGFGHPWKQQESWGRMAPREGRRRGVGWSPGTCCEWGCVPGCIPTLVGCTQQQSCCSLARGMLREGAAVPEAEGCAHPLSLGHKDHMQIPSPASATSDRDKQPKQGLQLQTLGCAASVPTSPLCNNPTFSQAWLSIAQSRAEQT